MIDPEKNIAIPESERWLLKNPEVGVSCSISQYLSQFTKVRLL